MLPPAAGPQMQGEPHSPVPPSARMTPARATFAVEAWSANAPPPFAPAVQHAAEPPPPAPKSDGSVIEPYVALDGVRAPWPPIPAYDAWELSAPLVEVPPSVMPLGELFVSVPSSLCCQAPR